MGEDALRALCGSVVEGRPDPGDVDADAIGLHGFLVRDPAARDPAVKEAALRAAVAAMGPAAYLRTLLVNPRGLTTSPRRAVARRGEVVRSGSCV
ncbi:hypothetical protein ACFC1F_36840, partial [Kitasatospora sp. NPDC056181]